MKNPLYHRPLPPQHKHLLKIDWFRSFTLRERLKILLGHNLNVLIRIKTAHHPGAHEPTIAAEVTPHLKPTEHLRAQIEADLQNQMYPTTEQQRTRNA